MKNVHILSQGIKILVLVSIAAPVLAKNTYNYIAVGASHQHHAKTLGAVQGVVQKIYSPEIGYFHVSADIYQNIFGSYQAYSDTFFTNQFIGIGYHFGITPQISGYALFGATAYTTRLNQERIVKGKLIYDLFPSHVKDSEICPGVELGIKTSFADHFGTDVSYKVTKYNHLSQRDLNIHNQKLDHELALRAQYFATNHCGVEVGYRANPVYPLEKSDNRKFTIRHIYSLGFKFMA